MTTKIYDGIIVSNNNDGRWNIRYNGEVHPVRSYGNASPAVDQMVKVFVPQGNQSLAWFLPSTLSSGGGGDLPPVTAADNGAFLRVQNGVWTVVQLSGVGGYVVGFPVAFTLKDWDTAIQGMTYELQCIGYKIGEGGLQIGLASDSSIVNAQAVVAAALTIADTKVTAPDQAEKKPGKTTVTISAVNVPERELVIALFGLEEAEPVTVSDADIQGVTVPVAGEEAVEEIDNEQYTGTITWSPDLDSRHFLPNTIYTATISLTAKVGYMFDGVTANFFIVAGASNDSNEANSGVVTAEFPATGTAIVYRSSIPGVGEVKAGETPAYSIMETSNFTGSISWSPAISGGVFAANTIYTATITLQAKPGFTFNGVPENFFDVPYADTTTNAANSNIVTAIFPIT